MTKLNWRLKELPTADEIASLVEQEVITKDEAREMLFKDKEEASSDKEIKSLREQIEFLERIVDSLSKNRGGIVTYTPTYPTYWKWQPNTVLCSSLGTLQSTSSGRVSGSATYSLNTAKLLS